LSAALRVVSDSPSVSAEKSSGVECERKAWVAMLAGERRWGDTRESWFVRAADKAKDPKLLPYRMIRALYYGEITDTEHPSMIALKNAAERFEIEDLADRLEKMAHRLRALLGARHA
jgi:hypothetical protein